MGAGPEEGLLIEVDFLSPGAFMGWGCEASGDAVDGLGDLCLSSPGEGAFNVTRSVNFESELFKEPLIPLSPF